jgi:hypothetical protein
VAFLVDTIEIFGLLSTELHIHGGCWDFITTFNINKVSEVHEAPSAASKMVMPPAPICC